MDSVNSFNISGI